MKKHIIIILVLFAIGCIASTASGAIIVGRIAHVEGQIYRYTDVDQSWVETFEQSPAGTQDVLTTGAGSRAEIAFPNNVQVLLDEQAEVEILNMEEGAGLFALHAGVARFHNLSAAGALAVETFMGRVAIGPGNAADVQVDGNSVVVSAVYGAVTFQSLINGIEKVEVISGSTSLEFYKDSIIAGIGPINRDWGRWCGERENVWARNRMVRSQYLPETMQKYAYVLQPNGNWRRIYYRGYYYWAWQPRTVAAGWSPYTTGFWYNWQGGPVWVDHNPWGWVTHHHGHWIHLQGAWMWTPYVHVSYEPGVTVVGFTISFAKTYRPYWHPGRVRWVSHDSYIGWLPLAPWETYYGYRSWGPGSVVMQKGSSFSININLAKHRYVDHAVIIPRQDFHRRGQVKVTNYKSVRVRNINKTLLVKNYKALPMAEEPKKEKHETKATRAGSPEKRFVNQPERRTARKEEVVTVQKLAGNGSLVNQAQKKVQQERIVYRNKQTSVNKETATNEQKRKITSTAKTQKRVVVSEQKTIVEKSERPKKTAPGRTGTAMSIPQRNYGIETENRGAKAIRPAVTETGNRSSARQRNIAVAAGQKSPAQPAKNRGNKIVKESTGNYAANERQQAAKLEKQITREQQYNGLQSASREGKANGQQAGRAIVSASENNRRLR